MARRNTWAAAAAALVFWPGASALGDVPAYIITEVNPMLGGDPSWNAAGSLNNGGEVVGRSWIYAFHWSDGVTRQLSGLSSSAQGINDLGDIVGSVNISGSGLQAVLWTGGDAVLLGSFAGGRSFARAINDDVVVGSSLRDAQSNTWEAFAWHDGGMVGLGTLGPGSSYAEDINALSQVVGWSNVYTPDGGYEPQHTRAFLWDDGEMINLGVLEPDHLYSRALSINDAGQVVGFSRSTEAWPEFYDDQAFLWQDGEMTALGSLPDLDRSYATSINNLGQVVGASWTFGFEPPLTGFVYRATLWRDGLIIDLNDAAPDGFGWHFEEAVAINDAGQILVDAIPLPGTGTSARPFLLTPTCPADWNRDGVVDSDDLLDFLADWAAGNADYNGDGVTDSDDLFDFLADWSAGC